MSCDPYTSRPILGGLPHVFKVNIRADGSGQWPEHSILHLVDEAVSGRIGSEAMLAKISEALFVDTLRRYVAGLPERQVGCLAGTRVPWWEKVSACFTAVLPIRGRSRIWRTR